MARAEMERRTISHLSLLVASQNEEYQLCFVDEYRGVENVSSTPLSPGLDCACGGALLNESDNGIY